LKMGDWPFHILHAQHGNICYINEVMGVHRIHQGGTWHSKSLTDQLLEIIEAYKFYDALFQNNSRYRKIIEDMVRSHFFTIAKEYEKIGNLKDANIYFKKAMGDALLGNTVELIPEIIEANYGKAIALLEMGQIDEAIKILKNLLSLMPENQEVRQLLKQISQLNTNRGKE
jgi:tetratricopeptide (TPR) repeat protein